MLAGVRGDFIHENLNDRLPPPGFSAARASTSQGEQSVDTSLTYKTARWNRHARA